MDSAVRAVLVDLLESALSDEQARIGDGALLAGTELAEALADALIHAGVIKSDRIVITCTQHGVVNCSCLSAPAGVRAGCPPVIFAGRSFTR